MKGPGTGPLISVEDLWHVYQPMGQVALRGVNLRIEAGEFVALIGQNGSGKTTLVKHFNGLLKPTRGRVTVMGMDTARSEVSDLARHVGYVFQNPDRQIFAESVREEVSFGPRNLGFPPERVREVVERVLRELDLEEFADVEPFMLGRGQRQRVAVASILAMEPEVLIIDEPTTGLDWRESVRLMDLVAQLNARGHTVIMTTHNMLIVSLYARRVVVLKDGEVLLDGPTAEVFRQVDALATAFIRPPQVYRLAARLAPHVHFPSLEVPDVARTLLERMGA